jgi:hypothetical protein
MTLEEIIEMFPEEEFLTADGFDGAIVGVEPNSMRLVYDRDKMICILMTDEEMEEIDAIEYLEYNTWNAYVGEKTPIFIEI